LATRAAWAQDVTVAETATPVPNEKAIVVWPTLTPAGDEGTAAALHAPEKRDGTWAGKARELDATLRDAVQDLGFTLDVADAGPAPTRTRDLDIMDRASKGAQNGAGTWVVSARLEPDGRDTLLLRIVVVPPKSRQLRVRVERVATADVSVRGLVLLRDLLASTGQGPSEAAPRPFASAGIGLMSDLHSQGRAVLAANAALFGAFTAYSIQRASGSEDPRLLYPLLTLGTGIGLGGALLAAEEWDIGTGDAWTLAGAAWWGAASGLLLASGTHVEPFADRYAWGVGGGLLGLSLATVSIARSKADEGDAALVHSGAAVGLGVGALLDYAHAGAIEGHSPHTGEGIGTAAGIVAAGALASVVRVSPSRVLLIDLGIGLGAASGAALASPLVFEDITPGKERTFLGATAGGALAGGAVAWFLTRHRDHAHQAKSYAVPYGGVIEAPSHVAHDVAYGAGVRGVW
jgi:hypothetical protein